MKTNERKIQLLSMLRHHPLTLKEMRERAGIEEKLLNALTWKYRRQGLIRRTSDFPVMMGITHRGRARLMYLTHPLPDHRIDTVPVAHRSSNDHR